MNFRSSATRCVVLVALALAACMSIFAQEATEPAIFGITLGMSKQQVAAKLSSSSYNFKKNASKDADMFAIFSGENSLGIVQFDKAERVFAIERDWTPSGEDRVSLVGAIYQAVQDIQRRDQKKYSPAIVSLSSVSSPGPYHSDNVVLSFGHGHNLTLNIFTSAKMGDRVAISETLPKFDR